jgi:hypothetical protein
MSWILPKIITQALGPLVFQRLFMGVISMGYPERCCQPGLREWRVFHGNIANKKAVSANETEFGSG